MWQSPWDNAVPGGDQVTHAIWALATGGSFGTGLGLGDTRYLPAGHTDLILAAIGEELGAAGLLLVAVLYALRRLARLPHRTARAKRLRFLPRHRADAVSDRAGADHGVRHPWRDAAHRRRDAISELRRVGDGRELLCAGHADRDPRRSSPLGRSRAVPRSGHVARVVARGRCAGSPCRGGQRPDGACGRLHHPRASRHSGRRRATFRIQPARARYRPADTARDDLRSPRRAAGHRRSAA